MSDRLVQERDPCPPRFIIYKLTNCADKEIFWDMEIHLVSWRITNPYLSKSVLIICVWLIKTLPDS